MGLRFVWRVLKLALACVGILAATRVAHAATITVNTTTDEFGSGANCSLREAVRTANSNVDFGSCTHTGSFGTDTILLSPGTYNLTLAGLDEDLSATADLDIFTNIIISATGSTPTIRGGAAYQGRLIHVQASGVATIKKVTMGISSVPSGRAGGCIRVESGGILTLDTTTVSNCTADGNSGGILNIGTLHIINSNILSNTTNGADGGGGIFNDNSATLYITNTILRGNTSTGEATYGGAIYSDGSSKTFIVDSTIEGNTADSGAGISCFQCLMMSIRRSTIRQNHGQLSGGIDASGSSTNLEVEDTLIISNEAIKTSATDTIVVIASAGIDFCCGTFTMRHSIVRNNITRNDRVENNAVRGGGINVGGGTILIEDSTISGNSVSGGIGDSDLSGGGIFALTGGSGRLTLVNTTVSGNTAERQGGGIYVDGSFKVALYNTTIFGNSGEDGGGVRILSGGVVTLTNSVIAGNVDTGSNNRDDCYGAIANVSFGHVQNSTGCSFGSGVPTSGASGLASLANNGGTSVGDSTSADVPRTHRPVVGSALIDAGDAAGCKDNTNAMLTTDQRGVLRPSNATGVTPRCDVGAVELHYPPFTVTKIAPTYAFSPSIAPSSVIYTITLQNTDYLTVSGYVVTDTLSIFMEWDTFPGSCVKNPYYVLVCTINTNMAPLNIQNIVAKASFLGAFASGACDTDFVNNVNATLQGFDGSAASSWRSTSASTQFRCIQARVRLPLVMK